MKLQVLIKIIEPMSPKSFWKNPWTPLDFVCNPFLKCCKKDIRCLKEIMSWYSISINYFALDIYENGKSDNPLRSKYTKEINHENIHRPINASLHQQCTSVLSICSLKIPLRPIMFVSTTLILDSVPRNTSVQLKSIVSRNF